MGFSLESFDSDSTLEGGFPGGSNDKESTCNAGDPGLTPGSGRSPGEGKRNPIQYSCLENPMDIGAWWTTVRGVTESDTIQHAHSMQPGL